MSDEDNSFTLKVKVGPELGMGFVQLFVDDDKYVISSNEFDEGIQVTSTSEVNISTIPSHGNEFISWSGKTSLLELPDGNLGGQVRSDMELEAEFAVSLRKPEPELVLPEWEPEIPKEPTEFSNLEVEVMDGQGVVSVEFAERTHLVNSTNGITFKVPVGWLVNIGLVPMSGYVFSGFDGSTTLLGPGVFEMGTQPIRLSAVFSKYEPEPEVLEEDEMVEVDVDDSDDMVDELLFGRSESLSFKGVGKFTVTPEEPRRAKLIPTENAIEFKLTYDDTYGVLLNGADLINGRWVDLIFREGVEYVFRVQDPRAMVEIVDIEGDLISSDLGVSNNAFTTNGLPMVIIPNEHTPRKLLYRERYPVQNDPPPTPTPTYWKTGIPVDLPLRQRHENGFYGKIHIGEDATFGRVCGYGYLEGATMDLTSELGDLVFATSRTKATGELQTPGIYSYTLTGTQFSSLDMWGGFDYMTQTDNIVHYSTVGRSSALNALTTLFRVMYDESTIGVFEINEYLCNSFDFPTSCDILNEDPLHEIFVGKLEYIAVYKKLVQLNVLLELLSDGESSERELLKKIGTLVFSGRKFDLVASAGSLITELLSDVYSDEALNVVFPLLYEVFTSVEDVTSGTPSEILNSLFAIGKVCSGDMVSLVRTLNLQSMTQLKNNFDDEVSSVAADVNSYPIPLRLPLQMTPSCLSPDLEYLGQHVTKLLDSGPRSFGEFLTGKSTLTLDNLGGIFGKTISIYWGDLQGCYKILNRPVEFMEYSMLYAPSVDNLFTPTRLYDTEYECCNDLEIYKFSEDDAEEEPITDVFSLKLVEGGESRVMYSGEITNKSHPIEYLGHDEYRVYLDEDVDQGVLSESSPGYFVVPKDFAIPMEQRYLKVVYNTDETVRDVIDAVSNKGYLKVITVAAVQYLPGTEYGKVMMITESSHGLVTGQLVHFISTDREEFNEIQYRVDVIGESIFYVSFKAKGYNDFKTFASVFDDNDVSIVSETIIKVRHGGSEYKIGDTVVFDKSCNGQTFNIIEVGTGGDEVSWFRVNEILPQGITKVVKSHVSEELTDVIDFMYVTHLQYYQVAGISYDEERLWLCYDPDTSPTGRSGHKVSYVQFFHNEL